MLWGYAVDEIELTWSRAFRVCWLITWRYTIAVYIISTSLDFLVRHLESYITLTQNEAVLTYSALKSGLLFVSLAAILRTAIKKTYQGFRFKTISMPKMPGFTFKNQTYTDYAMNNYMHRFSAEELGYMSDLSLSDIYPRLQQGVEIHSTIQVSAYLLGAMSAKSNTSRKHVSVKLKARVNALANITRSLSGVLNNPSYTSVQNSISPFLTRTELPSYEDFRLGLHLTMLNRIYESPRGANLMPELEAMGEGMAWESHWRLP